MWIRLACSSEFSGAGFSLWGFVIARTKTHRLKPAPLKSILVAADHDRHGHEAQNEHEDGDGRPDESSAIDLLPAVEQRRVAEANRQQQDGPHDPTGPENQTERDQEQRYTDRDFLVKLAGHRIQNMAPVKLSSWKQVQRRREQANPGRT